MTLEGNTIESNTADPDQTVLCQFLDVSNSYEDFALVTLGQRLATSPRSYSCGDQVVVVATRTSATLTAIQELRRLITVCSGSTTVELNLTNAGGVGGVGGAGVIEGGDANQGTDGR